MKVRWIVTVDCSPEQLTESYDPNADDRHKLVCGFSVQVGNRDFLFQRTRLRNEQCQDMQEEDSDDQLHELQGRVSGWPEVKFTFSIQHNSRETHKESKRQIWGRIQDSFVHEDHLHRPRTPSAFAWLITCDRERYTHNEGGDHVKQDDAGDLEARGRGIIGSTRHGWMSGGVSGGHFQSLYMIMAARARKNRDTPGPCASLGELSDAIVFPPSEIRKDQSRQGTN